MAVNTDFENWSFSDTDASDTLADDCESQVSITPTGRRDPLKESVKTQTNKFDVYDDFSISTIKRTDYSKCGSSERERIAVACRDLSAIVRRVVSGGTIRYVHKIIEDKGGYGIALQSLEEARKYFTQFHAYGLKKVKSNGHYTYPTLWSLLQKYSDYFDVERIKFTTDDPHVFSTFTGYAIQPADTVDMSLIQHTVDFFKQTLCGGNESQWQYFRKWHGKLFAEPTCRTGTSLIFLGGQGIGKTTFYANHLRHIIGSTYSCEESNHNNIFGTFNGKLWNKHLIILDESRSSSDSSSSKQTIPYDQFKYVVTNETIAIRLMRTDAFDADNVTNLIQISNHELTHRIDDQDRRCIYFDVNSEHENIPETAENMSNPIKRSQMEANNRYFSELATEAANPLFYPTLYAWFLAQYVKGWNPEAQENKPQSKTKERIIARCEDPLKEWIDENLQELADCKITTTLAWQSYKHFIEEGNFQSQKKMDVHWFKTNLEQKYDIVTKRITERGHKFTYYCIREGCDRYKKQLESSGSEQEELGENDIDQLSKLTEFMDESKRAEMKELIERLRGSLVV